VVVAAGSTTSVLGRRKSIHAPRKATAQMARIRIGGEIWLTVPHIGRSLSDP
jgi:hypothetical protein